MASVVHSFREEAVCLPYTPRAFVNRLVVIAIPVLLDLPVGDVLLITRRYRSGVDNARRCSPDGQPDRYRPVQHGMAEMLRGGVIMGVVTPEQARIAEVLEPSR